MGNNTEQKKSGLFGKLTPSALKVFNLSFFRDPFRIIDIAQDMSRAIKFPAFKKTSDIIGEFPQTGIFITGIESSDPFVEGRRNQLKEAHDFYANFDARLQKIYDLGIRWLRFGPPYSQTHLGKGKYDFEFMDKVYKKCQDLGITIIADLLHFGLPEWLHEDNASEPYFQNSNFPAEFAKYAEEFARRYKSLRFFTVVNEPFVTAYFSAKLGMWNEKRQTGWQDDRHFVNAVVNVARAAVLGRLSIEKVFRGEKRPHQAVYVQNESFEKAVAATDSGREEEAARFNLRKFAPLDLMLGHRDGAMKKYLLSQGLPKNSYDWFMDNGTTERVIIGIDHYPWCVHTFEKDKSVDHNVSHPYQLYDLTKEYFKRYELPLLHTEINAWPDFAGSICLLTYDALSRLRKEGYPILGMTWYGDEYQVGWQSGLTGKQAYEETPVGLYYKGQKQDVADLFSFIVQAGFSPIEKQSIFKNLIKKYVKTGK